MCSLQEYCIYALHEIGGLAEIHFIVEMCEVLKVFNICVVFKNSVYTVSFAWGRELLIHFIVGEEGLMFLLVVGM